MKSKYNQITDQDFFDAVQILAKYDFEHTLSIPGIYEIISEYYNNEALDLALENCRAKRKEHLYAFIQTQKVFHSPLNFSSAILNRTTGGH